MKKVLYTLAMVIIASLVSAQDQVVIKGTVSPGEQQEVLVREGNRVLTRIPLKPDGTFSGTLALEGVKELQVVYGSLNERIQARPGREINIRFGTPPPVVRDRGDMAARGARVPASPNVVSGSPETDYYNGIVNKIYPSDIRFIGLMPWQVFKRYQEDALEAKMLFSETFSKAWDIPDGFRRQVETQVTYNNYSSFIRWPGTHKMLTEVDEVPEEAESEAHLETLYKKIEWNDPSLVNVWDYVSFAQHYLDLLIKENLHGSSYLLDVYEVIADQTDNQEVKEFFIHRYTDRFLNGETPSNQSRVAQAYRERVRDPEYLADLDRIISEVPDFGVRTPAFDFTLEDVHGNMITLSDFVGKVVYIDFWATWCGPCLREAPYLKQLKEDLTHRDDIVVIGISTDAMRDKDKWKQMVKDMEMGDYQVFAGEKAPDLRKHYEITGIPHFVIIGKDGNIYQNKTIRPSNPQTRQLLLEVAGTH
jgi:thiol-disulfide isomerase/thioredoxin